MSNCNDFATVLVKHSNFNVAEAERQEMRENVRNSAKFWGNRFLAASKVISGILLVYGERHQQSDEPSVPKPHRMTHQNSNDLSSTAVKFKYYKKLRSDYRQCFCNIWIWQLLTKGRLNLDTKLSRDFKTTDMLKPSSMRTWKFERAFKTVRIARFH